MAMERDEAERRRRDEAEEERHYWESIEDDRREEEEREAQRRQGAIETMETWFFEQFEDPQIQTPRDGEDQSYIYPWGGPFEAADVLHGQFGHDFDQGLIDAAVEQIERDGTVEWAPAATGDYYEHPDPDDRDEATAEAARLTQQVLDRLDSLEAIVNDLPGRPGSIGHNAPPDEIGLPPYQDFDPSEAVAAIADTRAALTADEPDPAHIATLSRRFDGWGRKIGAYVAKKGDLMVDEIIKNGVKVARWSVMLGLFHEVAHDLLRLAEHLLARL